MPPPAQGQIGAGACRLRRRICRRDGSMLSIGDVHVYVHDFNLALRFWVEGLGLKVAEKEVSAASAFALLEFPEDGPAIRLFGGAEPWPEGARPDVGTLPAIHFDVVTADFDATLVRLLENAGQQLDEIETYGGCRVVTVADPDGNAFELMEVPTDEQ
jgi:predicted enzyme related to lactoylglutathione lyase